ncbi:hypothetical protein BJ742DRAFT_123466 [Cladochytrium replicatum]|nr:hypothetical protein BJ742DRAFT_123466 [Cladochytrium replicatum]
MGPDRVLRSRMEIYVDPPSALKEDLVKPPPRIRPNALRDVTSAKLKTTAENTHSFSSKLAGNTTKNIVPSLLPRRVLQGKEQLKSKRTVAEKPPPIETNLADSEKLHHSTDTKAILPAEDVSQATENITSASSRPISPRKRKVDGIPGADVSDSSSTSTELRTSKRYRTALQDHEGPGEPIARRHVSREQKSSGDDCNKENWDPLLQMYTTDPRFNRRASQVVRVDGSVAEHDESPGERRLTACREKEHALSGRCSRRPRADGKKKTISGVKMSTSSTITSENTLSSTSKPTSQPKKQTVRSRTVEERTNVTNNRAQPPRSNAIRDFDLSTLRSMR